jgi:hypothetical protein
MLCKKLKTILMMRRIVKKQYLAKYLALKKYYADFRKKQRLIHRVPYILKRRLRKFGPSQTARLKNTLRL